MNSLQRGNETAAVGTERVVPAEMRTLNACRDFVTSLNLKVLEVSGLNGVEMDVIGEKV